MVLLHAVGSPVASHWQAVGKLERQHLAPHPRLGFAHVRALPQSGASKVHFGADVLAHNFGAEAGKVPRAVRVTLLWATFLCGTLWAAPREPCGASPAYIRTLGRQENRQGQGFAQRQPERASPFTPRVVTRIAPPAQPEATRANLWAVHTLP